MKSAFIFSACLVLSALLITSCQREVEDIFDRPQEDNIYLKKEVSLDTTQPPGSDTAFISNYFYDSQKRLSAYDFTEIGFGGIRYRYDYRLYYNNNTDTLPSRTRMIYDGGPDSTVTYLYYTNAFITRDSSVYYGAGSPASITTRYFTSLGGNRYRIMQYDVDVTSGLSILSDSTIYYRTLVNGNVSNAVDSVWFSGLGYSYMFSDQRVFDNRKSPFTKFQVWYLGKYEHLVSEIAITGVNNLLSYSYLTDNTPPFSGSYSIAYSFNNDGYPVTARLTGNPDVNKAVFIYTTL